MKTVTIYTDGACSGNPGPGGWCAILEYNGHEKLISGGEERRLDLARTLWRQGSLVMLDEPTAGLDEKTRVELEKQIAQLPCEILIVAMHNYSPEFLDSFTKVLRIRDGEIVM